MKYCVTGGSGFIGSYFCKKLKDNGHEVNILDLVKPTSRSPHDIWVQGDVRDFKAVNLALENCDRIIHLAAAHHDFGIEDETYFTVNKDGTRVVTECADKNHIKEIGFFSTIALYGNRPFAPSEDTQPQPNSPYGESKLEAEKVLSAWGNNGLKKRVVCFRPALVFGPWNFANMFNLIRQIDSGKFFIVGKGENIKNLSCVHNIVEAMLWAFDQEDEPFSLYNFIEEPDTTSRQISSMIYKFLGKKIPSWSVPLWLAKLGALPFDCVIKATGKNLPVSSSRIEKLFVAPTWINGDKFRAKGWKSSVSVESCLEDMVKWYLETGSKVEVNWNQPPKKVQLLIN